MVEKRFWHFCSRTWYTALTRDKLSGKIVESRQEPDIEKKIDMLIAVLVNIRLLDKEEKSTDNRDIKENIETIYQRLLPKLCDTQHDAEPTNEYIYYCRESTEKTAYQKRRRRPDRRHPQRR
ncbi:hypothetical protein MASR1M12_37490 [Erysipelotrichia bacterium]